jgi:predicted transcriptional regulator
LFRYSILIAASLSFALLTTFLFLLQVFGIFSFSSPGLYTPPGSPSLTPYLVLAILQSRSAVLAPLSWGIVLGGWIWRGRMKAEWGRRGLDRSSFRLFLQMRGSTTRIVILKALSTPRDRFQLSKELGLDWATIDYHIQILLKHGLISEKAAFGNVKFYELTSIGSTLLQALEEMDGTVGSAPSKKS